MFKDSAGLVKSLVTPTMLSDSVSLSRIRTSATND